MMALLEYGGFATGVLVENRRPEYAQAYGKVIREEMGKQVDREKALEPRFTSHIQERVKVMMAGAAGGRVKSSGHLLGQGAVLSGLYATQRDDYPVTVMTGHSTCEVILDTQPIGYTGIPRPDVLIWVAEEGRTTAAPRLADMTPADRLYIATDLLPDDKQPPLNTRAQVVPLNFSQISGFRVTRQNRALLALAAVLQREGWYPFEAIQEAVRQTQREQIAASNLETLAAGVTLL